jgi:mannose-6-phosphate isomerase-like protein (cupin superfamily)
MTVVLGPGEGESMTLFGNELTIKTGGAFCLIDYTAGPDFPGPPPHVHHETVDSFYILEGELTVRIGDETRTLGAGSFALVPPETVHTFSNPGDRPVRFLERIGEIAARYDVETVDH